MSPVLVFSRFDLGREIYDLINDPFRFKFLGRSFFERIDSLLLLDLVASRGHWDPEEFSYPLFFLLG